MPDSTATKAASYTTPWDIIFLKTPCRAEVRFIGGENRSFEMQRKWFRFRLS